ncbi:gluconate 2-dehydrogenase subunit 3 family protein [Rufibacter latericius]|uniref:Gluconate 2-dehydrogenase subunit 3 family protein n=1 Tax=Rufibacter latericius TaxID=2487040 RepID=A0A3M9M898_9BACT|nr:gluconate 2-dehydrogenase subunit 3 family protein [Rufibacter latericius]RNI21781.1 gluconate 2-dehydrogenase subunit 3 family protein [Rufibacter latericius]
MNRRTAVKGLLIFTGGLMLVPSCMMESSKASIKLKHLSVSGEEEKMLAELVETLIPTTDTAGGKALGLHKFTLKMVDDLFSPEDQKAFTEGMDAFQKHTKKQTGNTFVEATPQQRQEIIAAVNAGKAPEEVLAFYKILKDQTIRGYLNSELVMTKLRKYELVPSRYLAYYPVKAAKASNNG